jgi:SAM-dependent methyltransferase
MQPKILTDHSCPICGYTLCTPFFDAGEHPLATLGWPDSSQKALAMPSFKQFYANCPACNHVWNTAFSYDSIPYQNNPNRMYNKGGLWQGHLATTRDLLLKRLPESPTIIDIGCGEGHFVRGLAEARAHLGRFVGFDPNTTSESGRGLEFHPQLFSPLEDMGSFFPDALAIRHVLEHLTDPASLIEQLAWGASMLEKPVWLFAEVPCIDRVFETGRLADFFYEHPAQFSTQSFHALMARAGEIHELAHGYEGEVVYALVRLGVPERHQKRAQKARAFHDKAISSQATIRNQLDEIAASGKSVAIWGGTGKAAAFMHQFGADAKRFPLVVDSDPDKVGSFVPGTGQGIVFRDVLKQSPISTVIIPTQWRAKDIVAEMKRENISSNTILIEHDGHLVDFFNGAHPYR